VAASFDSRVQHTLDGAEITYRMRPGRDPWVLLHALGCDGTMWDPVVEALPEDMGLVIPDLRGHGGSTLGWRTPSVDLWADDVARLLKREQIARAGVAGLSMGGYTALALAVAAPGIASAYALVDTSAEADDPEARLRRALSLGTIRREGWRAYAQASIPSLLAPNRPDGGANRERLLAMYARAGDSGLTAALFALADRPPRRSMLGSIGVPTVAVVGEHDGVTPLVRAEEIAAATGGRLVVLPGVGHLSALEAPAEVAAAIAGTR
jgi:pimeloyl-ACP methyl ester carboxylesterase